MDGRISLCRLTIWFCMAAIIGSVLSCVVLAINNSNGLVAVKVTAIDPAKEPKDLKVPLANPGNAAPDYELTLIDELGNSRYLGEKPNESAAEGLTWQLADPVSVSRIATIRLREKDMVMSENLAEIQVHGDLVESKGYRFEFQTERSFSAGVQAFFRTPVGIAIAAGFFLAVVVLVIALFLQ
jgi:hypothetical protein